MASHLPSFNKARRFFKQAGSRFCMLLLAGGLSAHIGHAQGTWTPIANAAPDYNDGVMLLLSNGDVMVKTSAGGNDGLGTGWDILSPDIHGSYTNGTWHQAAYMYDSRLYFSSQVMRNGKVYVAGGEYGTGGSVGEVYNPHTDTWTPAPPLPDLADTILDANSEILPDGRVMQAVVYTDGNAYVPAHTHIYDPATNTYTQGPNTLGSNIESSWLKFPDNSFLFVNVYSTNAERYIPATNTWIHDAGVPVELYDPYGYEEGAAFLLPDGRGFFLGSSNKTAYYTPSGTTAHGTWTAGPLIPDSLGAPDAAAAMMVNGKILCALAHTPSSDTIFYPSTTFYEFNYLDNSFTQMAAPAGGDTLDGSAYITNMLCLPDGSILYSNLGDDQYYVYKPTGSALAAGKPTVDTLMAMTTNCDTFMATGKLFNGITEGACYGDDWQMNTNYPIIRISRNDTVLYATTYNWNSTGVMRGANKDSTLFVVPQGLQAGTYSLEVTANGNASDPVAFVYCPSPESVKNVAIANGMTVYPNPAESAATVNFTSKAGGAYTLKLIDVLGRNVKVLKGTASAGGNNCVLHVEGIAKGAYTIMLNMEAGTYSTKLTVK